MKRTLCVPVLVAGLLLVAGCSSGTGEDPAPTPTPSATEPAPPPPDASASPSTSATDGTAWGSLPGCPAVGTGVPDAASSAPSVDVDGDGRPDTQWVDDETDVGGGVPFGVTTASGADVVANFASASPVERSVLFADVTGDGEVVALASDGRQVQLWEVSDCSLVQVTDDQGAPYLFDLGVTGFGTGVGCSDVDGDGVADLVGLLVETDAAGTPVDVRRTIIELDGSVAAGGATDQVPPTGAAVASGRAVTCGELNLLDDGAGVVG